MEDVAVVDDTFMTEFKDAFSYRDAFADIEGQAEGGEVRVDEDDDVLPQAAQDMGSGERDSSGEVVCVWGGCVCVCVSGEVVCVCMCLCVCVCFCMGVCVCVCFLYGCVCVCVSVFGHMCVCVEGWGGCGSMCVCVYV